MELDISVFRSIKLLTIIETNLSFILAQFQEQWQAY